MHFEANYFVASIAQAFPEFFYKSRVLEVGSMYVNTSIRTHFSSCTYTGLDLIPGKGVDVVASGHRFIVPESFDLSISCESFEHNPYFKETFLNMVNNTTDGGLVVFTCASIGRAEHGTRRTDATQSPGSSMLGWDYYKNLQESDFLGLLENSPISLYRFWTNENSCDLYFIGVKGEASESCIDNFNQVERDILRLSKYSKVWQSYWVLLHTQDASRFEQFEAVLNENPHSYILSSTLYWLANAFINKPESYSMIISYLERYLFHYPCEFEILALYGQFLFKYGNIVSARKIFESILSSDSKNFTAIQFLAGLESNIGNKKEALELFKTAVKLRPGQVWINTVIEQITNELCSSKPKARDFFRKHHSVKDGDLLFSYLRSSKGVNSSNCKSLKIAIPGTFIPSFETKKNIIVYPYTMPNHVTSSKESEMVVYDQQGRPIPISAHYKSIYTCFNSAENLGEEFDNWFSIEDGIYCGVFMPHYGHFILETMSRLWLLIEGGIDLKGKKFIFNLFQDDRTKGISVDRVFSGYFKEYFEAVGIKKDDVFFVNSPVKIKESIILSNSVSLSNVDCFASREAVALWRFLNESMSKNADLCSKYIYISRKSLISPVQGRVLVNEDELEDCLKKLGFYILSPEKLNNESEKQTILSNANIVVGCVGSGLLNSVFSPKGTHVVSICNPLIAQINPAVNHQISMDYFCENPSHLYVEDECNVFENGAWEINIDRFQEFIAPILERVL